jgi:hypothetical protein
MTEVTTFSIGSTLRSPTSQLCVNIAFNICADKTGKITDNGVIVITGFVHIQIL